jgi:regulator of nonsense transcripts 2
LPSLPTTSQKSDSILIGSNNSSNLGGDEPDEISLTGGKWEDEEERRFFEEVQDLKDFVPRSVLGIGESEEKDGEDDKEKERERIEREKEEVRKLEEELEKLGGNEVIPELLTGSELRNEPDDQEYAT